MANDLYTPEQAARSSIAALRWLTTIPRTVRQDIRTDFAPGRGAVVNVPKPITVGDARTYTKANRDARAAIVFDELDQDTVPVTLEDQVYKAVRLPDDFTTFTLQDLERQVLKPMAESVVDALSAPLKAKMEAIASASGLAIAADGSNALAVVTKARRVLNGRKVPFADRFLAVGSGVAEKILNLKELTDASQSGSDGALREAIIGRLRGFTVVEDPLIGDDLAIAYHRDAFTHITVPSAAPRGAGFTAALSQDGFALRYIQHYNPLQLEDQAVVDTFVGAETLDAARAVKITTAA